MIVGLALGGVALLLGGAEVEPVHSGAPRTFAAGLDYFVLELLVLGLVLIPLEGVVAWREQRAVAAQPLRLQLPQMLLIELATCWVHRAFHALPWLWRFHAIHPLSTAMD